MAAIGGFTVALQLAGSGLSSTTAHILCSHSPLQNADVQIQGAYMRQAPILAWCAE
jgi:hypothetical protein